MSKPRLACLAAVAFLAALAAAPVAFASEPDAAEALFQARCGDCHGARELAYWAGQRPEPAEHRA